jgi:hypothetical protein
MKKPALYRRRTAKRTRPTLVGHLDAWRDAADDLEAAWRRWRSAVSPDARADSALAFFAALDREETAAGAFQLAWES